MSWPNDGSTVVIDRFGFVGSPFIVFNFTANSHSVFLAPTSSGRIIMAEKKVLFLLSAHLPCLFHWLTHSLHVLSGHNPRQDTFPHHYKNQEITPTDLGQIHMSNIWAELDLLCPVQWNRGNRFKRANHKLNQACVCLCAYMALCLLSQMLMQLKNLALEAETELERQDEALDILTSSTDRATMHIDKHTCRMKRLL